MHISYLIVILLLLMLVFEWLKSRTVLDKKISFEVKY